MTPLCDPALDVGAEGLAGAPRRAMLTPEVLTAMVLTATEAEPMQAGSGPHGRRRPTVRAAAMALAVLTAGVAALAGCAPRPTAAPETTPQVEVYSWWASGSEKLALDALVGVFGEQFPQTRFVDSGIAGGAGWTAKDLLRSRLESGDAPDTFQVHGGAELARLEDVALVDRVAPALVGRRLGLLVAIGGFGHFSPPPPGRAPCRCRASAMR